MEGKELFRSVLMGGYDKEEVIEYVNSLECNYERQKIDFMMEKKDLLDKLETMEKELEQERENQLIQRQKVQELQEEKEEACRRVEEVCLEKAEIQRQLEEVEGQLEEMRRGQQELEGQNSEKFEKMFNQIRQQENKLLEIKDKIKESIRRQKEEQQSVIAALQEKLREREKECEYYSKEIRNRDMKIQEMEKAREKQYNAAGISDEPSARPEPEHVAETVSQTALSDEEQYAQQPYRKYASDMNRSIASAQERIARMLEELQQDVAAEKV